MNRHQRRVHASAYRRLRRNCLGTDIDLTHAAMRNAREMMTGYGNVLTPEHEKALFCIMGRYTQFASRAVEGRYAYDLPCGGGKTVSIVAWCKAVFDEGHPYSVLICASRVEELCSIYDQLVNAGIGKEKIGLKHSIGSKARHPSTDGNEGRQFLLVTHSRIRGPNPLSDFTPYRGKDRDLVVWDESLLASEHRFLALADVRASVAYFKDSKSTELQRILGFVSSTLGKIDPIEGGTDECVPPSLSPDMAAAWKEYLPGNRYADALKGFLEMCQYPLRVLKIGGNSVARYEIVVPEQLSRVVVLDASYTIRELEKMDTSIKEDKRFNGIIKSYETCTVRQLMRPGGRDSLEKSFRLAREKRLYAEAVLEAVSAIPEEDAVLVFTFKKRAVDIVETLKSDFRAAGIDPDALLPNGKRRIVFATFGQETATSEWKHCSHVFFMGVLRRSLADLAGAMVGQMDDLRASIEKLTLDEVERSERAHVIYQAANRAAMRDTVEGRAKPTTVWIIDKDDGLEPILKQRMPGLKWEPWEASAFKKAGKGESPLAKGIRGYLQGLPADCFSVSVAVLKKDLGIQSSGRPFRDARDAALVGSGWAVSSRSLVRDHHGA